MDLVFEYCFYDEDDNGHMTVMMMMMTLENCILIMIVSREANCCGEHWACSSTGEIEERSQNSSEGT